MDPSGLTATPSLPTSPNDGEGFVGTGGGVDDGHRTASACDVDCSTVGADRDAGGLAAGVDRRSDCVGGGVDNRHGAVALIGDVGGRAVRAERQAVLRTRSRVHYSGHGIERGEPDGAGCAGTRAVSDGDRHIVNRAWIGVDWRRIGCRNQVNRLRVLSGI